MMKGASRAPSLRALTVTVTLATSTVATGSCGRAEGSGNVTTVVDSSAGFPVLRHNGTPVEWRAEVAVTVGTDTAGPYQFGRIASVALDRRGSIFILDAASRQLSTFDSLGTFRGLWGRRGRGPGEYVSPQSIAMLHDSVALLDLASTGVVKLYAPNGQWIRDQLISWPSGEHGLKLYPTPPDGYWISTYVRSSVRYRHVIIHQLPSGTADTIDEYIPIVLGSPPITCEISGGFSWYPVPFGPVSLSRPLPNGEQAVAISGSYRIAVLASDGDTARVVERDAIPGPIGDDEWNREVAKFRTWRATRGNPKCTANDFDRPSARPVLESMFIDDERQLWVESHSPGGSIYEVFGLDGSLRARVTGLPPTGGVDPSIVGGRIAMYAPDENDIPRVRVFRIRKP